MGRGKTPLPISPVYIGSVNVLSLEKRDRVRIEITSPLVKDFLERFINKEKIALFAMSLDKLNEMLSPENMGDLLERFRQNSKGEKS